jgi:hypothetical protein
MWQWSILKPHTRPSSKQAVNQVEITDKSTNLTQASQAQCGNFYRAVDFIGVGEV